ncbi:MAD2 mitotic arrest deficient-like 2 [Homalodisca vitripennis]|nr:MAD2 mitotic arrest deficient-like 2 [Homalodisca vitripennis]
METDTINKCSVEILLEFFEVCIHSILYIRKVYPPSIFTLKKKYNVPVHISLYPDLNLYISSVLKSVKTFLMTNKLQQLSLCILDSSLKPVEKFVFNNFNINSSSITNHSDMSHLLPLEESFRAFCLKLSTSDYILKPIPDNSSFKIYVKTEGSILANMYEDPTFEAFPWIAENKISENELHEISPLLSLHTPNFQFETYVEI